MDELKVTTVYDAYWKANSVGEGTGVLVYLKSEADKVISELEESHKKEVKQLLILNREQANAANRLRDSMEQTIRHQKYKRCLAMARWCDSEMNYWYDRIEMKQCKRFKFYEKWYKRWLELAKKLKEAK